MNETPAVTACREFSEETGKVLHNDVIKKMRRLLESADSGAGNGAQGVEVCWFGDGKYILFMVCVDMIPDLGNSLKDIVSKFDGFMKSFKKHFAPHEQVEMSALKWVPLDGVLTNASFPLSEFARKLMSKSELQEWIGSRSRQFSATSSVGHLPTSHAVSYGAPASVANGNGNVAPQMHSTTVRSGYGSFAMEEEKRGFAEETKRQDHSYNYRMSTGNGETVPTGSGVTEFDFSHLWTSNYGSSETKTPDGKWTCSYGDDISPPLTEMVRLGSRGAQIDFSHVWPSDEKDVDASQASSPGYASAALQLVDSYVLHERALPSNEENMFEHAGILLYRYNQKKSQIEGLFGHSFNRGNITILVCSFRVFIGVYLDIG